MKTNKKIIIYKIILVLLIIALFIIGGIIIFKQFNDFTYDKENKEIAEMFEKIENSKKTETEKENELIELQYRGFNVIGLIEIPTIDLKYPIIEKTTQETMKISISRFYGGAINDYGNVSLAGHNNYNGTMFGKNKKLVVGDKIYLTDLNSKKIEYVITEIFVTDPNDTSILETKDKTIRELTLITCKNGRTERLIIKAIEKK